MDNISIFDIMHPTFKIDKPVRLIELFAGVGSQAMALRNIGVDFEHYRVVELDKYALASYNAIHGTDFKITDITEVKGTDLAVVNTNKYCYIMTYSFPCQDLSVAGKMKGMTKDSGTRSGLLWEVERLLNEVDNLPQVLLMENVPQVISQQNIKDFHLWQKFLEDKGYSNYVETLNAKNYGIAQNRDRTFMVSLLGEWNYSFPKPIPLTKTMKDYLEDEVDEKYYINNEKAQKLIDELNAEIQRKIQPKIDKAIEEYHEKYNAAVEQAKTDATRNALLMIYPIACNSIYEAYGIGTKRMDKFLEYFSRHLECLNSGVTDVDDYKKWCEDEKIKYFDVVEVEDE